MSELKLRFEEVTGRDQDGNEVIQEVERRLVCNALLPRKYRAKFGHDLIYDMNELAKSYTRVAKSLKKGATEAEKMEAQFSVTDLTVFENVAWLMMKVAGEDVGEDPDEWLERVSGFFSIYVVLPAILQLWAQGNRTTSTP